MNKILLALCFATLCCSAPFDKLMANSYSTNFPAGELSKWLQGGTSGINWCNVLNVPGFAYGSQDGSQVYNDSTAVVPGTWGNDQSAQATVAVPSAPSENSEVELRLRTSISSGRITGYEFNASVTPQATYMQIVRWNGPLDDFTQIGWANTGVHTGDVIMAKAVGDQLSWYKNGTLVCSANDSTYPGGSPGIGFYSQDASINLDFGLSSFSANDNGSPTPTPSATPPPPQSPYALWESALESELRSLGVHANQLNTLSSWLASHPPTP